VEQATDSTSDSSRYRICINGLLDPRWAAWFDGIMITHDMHETTLLTGQIDQAALYGLIAKLGTLGLTLLSIARDS
jgi:hypothetical protein